VRVAAVELGSSDAVDWAAGLAALQVTTPVNAAAPLLRSDSAVFPRLAQGGRYRWYAVAAASSTTGSVAGPHDGIAGALSVSEPATVGDLTRPSAVALTRTALGSVTAAFSMSATDNTGVAAMHVLAFASPPADAALDAAFASRGLAELIALASNVASRPAPAGATLPTTATHAGVELAGLLAATPYAAVAVAEDAAGNFARSAPARFLTAVKVPSGGVEFFD
jgi:hypothetical protein